MTLDNTMMVQCCGTGQYNGGTVLWHWTIQWWYSVVTLDNTMVVQCCSTGRYNGGTVL